MRSERRRMDEGWDVRQQEINEQALLTLDPDDGEVSCMVGDVACGICPSCALAANSAMGGAFHMPLFPTKRQLALMLDTVAEAFE